MSIAQAVENRIDSIPQGQIFGYRELPSYVQSPATVIRVMSRLVSEKRIKRISKGKFYVPQKGLLGDRKPADNEIVRSCLFKNGKPRGYVTGTALFNQLGLTTQVPKTVTISANAARQEKDFGTLKVKMVVSRAPVKEKDIPLLQYLDVLEDIKKISDTSSETALERMKMYIQDLSEKKKERIVVLADKYYPPRVKALVGLLFVSIGISVNNRLKRSLNPTTIYRINIDASKWPQSKEWNIR